MNLHPTADEGRSARAPCGLRLRTTHRTEGPLMPHRQAGAQRWSPGSARTSSRGLTQDEARRRLEQYGPNQLKSAPETPWWRRLLEQFENFLVIILLVATVISVARMAAAGAARERPAL